MSETDPDCPFCRIVAGSIPATVVAESEHSLAFRDLDPQAPTHVLVVPRRHEPAVVDLAAREPAEAADLLSLAGTVARSEGLDGGYRLVVNTGEDGQQTVPHVHVHVLGGRPLTWPPG